jgi:hypothetical protein
MLNPDEEASGSSEGSYTTTDDEGSNLSERFDTDDGQPPFKRVRFQQDPEEEPLL